MRITVLPMVAAALLLAACEEKPATTADTNTTPSNTAQPASTIQAGSVEDFTRNVGDRVFFDFDKYELLPAAQATLQRQAAWLKQYAQYRITIEGHADERGTREYNLALGERRANAVKDYLVSLGVPAARLTTISYGKERPAVLGSNEAAWSQNRRGVTVLSR